MKTIKSEKIDAKRVVKDVCYPGNEETVKFWSKKIDKASSVIEIDNIVKSFWKTVLGNI